MAAGSTAAGVSNKVEQGLHGQQEQGPLQGRCMLQVLSSVAQCGT